VLGGSSGSGGGGRWRVDGGRRGSHEVVDRGSVREAGEGAGRLPDAAGHRQAVGVEQGAADRQVGELRVKVPQVRGAALRVTEGRNRPLETCRGVFLGLAQWLNPLTGANNPLTCANNPLTCAIEQNIEILKYAKDLQIICKYKYIYTGIHNYLYKKVQVQATILAINEQKKYSP